MMIQNSNKVITIECMYFAKSMYFSKVKQKFELTHSTSASFCNLDPIMKIHHNQLSSLDILS